MDSDEVESIKGSAMEEKGSVFKTSAGIFFFEFFEFFGLKKSSACLLITVCWSRLQSRRQREADFDRPSNRTCNFWSPCSERAAGVFFLLCEWQ